MATKTSSARVSWLGVALAAFACAACGGDGTSARDAGSTPVDAGDTGADAAPADDAGAIDAGTASPDAGPADAGEVDGGSDGGPVVVMPDAGSDAGGCADDVPDDFGDMCFGGTDCSTGTCWMSPLVAGECQLGGCTASCESDAQCRCYASEAGATAPDAASCVEGACDLTGTGLGGPILCT